jgi:hypothetical protein
MTAILSSTVQDASFSALRNITVVLLLSVGEVFLDDDFLEAI